jgi:hypothetical protein
MIRTQISLTEEQATRLRRVAARRGVSMAELIRQAIDRVVPADADERARRVERAVALAGKFDSGLSDVSERHDDYLATDFDDE